jgi:hypothetical protein
MSLLNACTTSVVALPNTGFAEPWIMAGVGGVIVVGGITAVVMAKTLKGKLTALAIPFVAAAGIALGNPQPSFAATGAPTVTTQAVIVNGTSSAPLTTARFEISADAVFNNPENCGTLSYQWEASPDGGSSWVADGPASSTPVAHERAFCDLGFVEHLKVTLTNRWEQLRAHPTLSSPAPRNPELASASRAFPASAG